MLNWQPYKLAVSEKLQLETACIYTKPYGIPGNDLASLIIVMHNKYAEGNSKTVVFSHTLSIFMHHSCMHTLCDQFVHSILWPLIHILSQKTLAHSKGNRDIQQDRWRKKAPNSKYVFLCHHEP